MAAKVKRFSKTTVALLTVLCFLLGAFCGAYYRYQKDLPTDSDPFITGALSIHFLELGNDKAGDCTFIQIGTVDILVDAGSDDTSIPTIQSYLDAHMQDDLLDYVIVTHAHEDHYAGFATAQNTDSLFDIYTVGTIIDFPMTNQNPDSGLYKNYLRERSEEVASGAVHYSAQDCISQNKRSFSLIEGVTLEILDSYYYTHQADSENDYSVCFLIRQDQRTFLFTGDLTGDTQSRAEQKLLEANPTLGAVTLYKAGHHGSNTSSTSDFLAVIRPQIVCIPCVAGSPQYTSNPSGQFPTQNVINRIAPYTSLVYVTSQYVAPDSYTSLNGNIVVTSGAGDITVVGSASSAPLKDSAWFLQNRTMPAQWAS